MLALIVCRRALLAGFCAKPVRSKNKRAGIHLPFGFRLDGYDSIHWRAPIVSPSANGGSRHRRNQRHDQKWKEQIMSIRTALLCAGLALGASLAPALASARTYVDIDIAPPAPREEVIPAARVGYVWAPGYWSWRHHDHVWVSGHYIHEHHGHHWVADRWGDYHGRYRYEPGHWDRDRH
jgi:hypothetical protein